MLPKSILGGNVVAMTFHDSLLEQDMASADCYPALADAESALPLESHQMVRALERAFGQVFNVIDPGTGQTVRSAANGLAVDLYKWLPLCQQIAQRGRPEILEDLSPLLLLAVPLPETATGSPLLATATFVTQSVNDAVEIAAAANELGLSADHAYRWAQKQTPWPAHAIQEVSIAISEKTALQQTATQYKRQLADISSHLLMTFEEITLLHRLTEHLSIAQSVTD
jgi:hypothetical protein